jgi:hypothetical protein
MTARSDAERVFALNDHATGRSPYAELLLKALRGQVSRRSWNVPARKPLFHGQSANAVVSSMDSDFGSSGFV